MSSRSRAAATAIAAGAMAVLMSALATFPGCAHVAAPPGGPPDSIPPLLIAVQPDSLAVVPGFDGEVRFEFDEPISERGIPTSAILYPLDLRPKINKGKRELKIKPREGWIENRLYHVRIEPVIQDLFNNVIREPIYHVFSTGLPIPDNEVRGTVYDRITGQILRQGRVDMVKLPDTLRYGGELDTAGAFGIANLPPGDYLAIGYQDVNGNRRADEFDRADTARVRLDAEEALTLEFDVFRHDTIGPVLALAEPLDSMVLELEFDGYLDPEVLLATSDVRVFALEDSAPVAIDTVFHFWQYTVWRDSVEAVRRARADSLAALEAAAAAAAAAAADTTAVPDTAFARDTLAAEVPPPELEPVPEEAPEVEAEELEEPARLPDRRIYVIASVRVPIGTHIVTSRNIVNLSGLTGGGEAEFEPLAPEPEEEPPEPPPDPPPPN